MAGDMMGMATNMAKKKMENGQETGSYGNEGGYQKYMGMAQPPTQPQAPQGMQQNGAGMDQQFQSLIQMLMGGQQPRGR